MGWLIRSALLVLARISLSLPSSMLPEATLIPDQDHRLERIYSFVGTFAPLQDTDCDKQPKIQNIHDPAESYRQSIQNALVTTGAEEDKTVQKTSTFVAEGLIARQAELADLQGSHIPSAFHAVGRLRSAADRGKLPIPVGEPPVDSAYDHLQRHPHQHQRCFVRIGAMIDVQRVDRCAGRSVDVFAASRSLF